MSGGGEKEILSEKSEGKRRGDPKTEIKPLNSILAQENNNINMNGIGMYRHDYVLFCGSFAVVDIVISSGLTNIDSYFFSLMH